MAFGHFLLGSHIQIHGDGSWLVCEVALNVGHTISFIFCQMIVIIIAFQCDATSIVL